MKVPPESRAFGWNRALRLVLFSSVFIVVVVAGLFGLNGIVLARGNEALVGLVDEVAPAGSKDVREVRILAFNLAKLNLHHGSIRFDSVDAVRQRVRAVGALFRDAAPDIVCLSEVVQECSLCPVDQVRELAREAGLRHYAFGECYNFGLPFFRIVGGNAILSRWAIDASTNDDIPGHKPFWVTRNNRRTLSVRIPDLDNVWVASVHHDSFDADNNLAQVHDLLQFTEERAFVVAGDFNALPASPSMRAMHECGRFGGAFEGVATYPADAPTQRIDYVLAPAAWRLVREEVLPPVVSDHRAVLGVFER
ncbi:MAG: endonuclease/exonuclease/phosphatase family protein [Planctomycetes bacterium]|nr:endonuclease/exonuclease/phosphatase family protein [Planctomycetota bacterium]MCB9920490.1 endonuclease/exonuclease/phosphatase family protein [Planctomycetota bacterium]